MEPSTSAPMTILPFVAEVMTNCDPDVEDNIFIAFVPEFWRSMSNTVTWGVCRH